MLEKITRKLNLRKDKGYAWCILVMSFLSHIVHTGFSFPILGNLTIAHHKLFKLSIQQSALIGSVETGLFLMLAPLASVLLKKTNCRVTELIGGVSLILGIGLSSLTTQPWHAYLLYGVVAAWGFSCCYVATSSILSLHFDKNKYMAFAIAMLGYYVGMAAWPTVSQKLFNIYGYNKAMGIMASFHVLHLVAGVLFFEPLKKNTEVKGSLEVVEKNGLIKDKSEDLLLAKTAEDTKEAVSSGDANLPTPVEEKNGDTEETVRESLLVKTNNGEEAKCSKQSNQVKPSESLKESFRILFSTPKVWSYLANSFFWCFNVSSFLILVNAYVTEKLSITTEEAALGITILGVANFVGNGIVIAASRRAFNRLLLHICCSIIFGISTIIISFSINKAMFYAFCVIWGLGKGMHLSNRLAVVSEIAGAERLPLLFGIGLFGEGLGSLGAAPLCGHVAKTLGDKYGLILSGIFGIVAGIIMLPVVVYSYMYTKAKAAGTTASNGEAHDEKPDAKKIQKEQEGEENKV